MICHRIHICHSFRWENTKHTSRWIPVQVPVGGLERRFRMPGGWVVSACFYMFVKNPSRKRVLLWRLAKILLPRATGNRKGKIVRWQTINHIFHIAQLTFQKGNIIDFNFSLFQVVDHAVVVSLLRYFWPISSISFFFIKDWRRLLGS